MGDWRTLHLFDKTKYMEEVVLVVRDLENYLPSFLNDRHLNWLDGFSRPPERILKDTGTLVSELDAELSIHPVLTELKQIANKQRDNYFLPREQFIRQRQVEIEFFEYVLIETIFARFGNFNPHFILGKRLFESCVETTNNSIAQELTARISSTKEDTVLDLIDGGIMNWLSKEETELLYWDRDHIFPVNEENEVYVTEFKAFLKEAYERNLGLITLRNPVESDLNRFETGFPDLVESVKNASFQYLVIREADK